VRCTLTGFLSLDDLAEGQGELALSLEFEPNTQNLSINACAPLPADTTREDVAVAYFSLCDLDIPPLRSFFSSHSNSIDAEQCRKAPGYTLLNTKVLLAIFAGKKYKPVTLKVCPVETKLPSRF
jgi:hypothetical protein